MRSARAAGFLSSLFVLTALSTHADAGVPGTITRLSTGSALATQSAPAISGNNVVWTDTSFLLGSTNSDIYFLDLAGGLPALNLSNTFSEQEYLEDVDGQSVVYTHTGPGMPGDILVYDTALNMSTTVAASDSLIRYTQPAIRGRYVVFMRYVGAQPDVDGYDIALGAPLAPITNDPAAQLRPRVAGELVVFEDYNSGNADIYGYRINSGGAAFAIATGPNAQITPDVDEDWVVWVETLAPGHDRVMARNMVTGADQVLSSVVSSKMQPRVSRGRVVWADDRAGNMDIWSYNLVTSTEEVVVDGAGDQMLSDIDRNRVVYTSNETGFEQIYMFTIAAPPPSELPVGCDPALTDLVGTPTVIIKNSSKPVTRTGSFLSAPPKRYYMCVENGLPDGSRRSSNVVASVDGVVVLTNNEFRPANNPPRWVAAPLNIHDDNPAGGLHTWQVAVVNTTVATLTISIRSAK
jgi:beta propeller repeat protein